MTTPHDNPDRIRAGSDATMPPTPWILVDDHTLDAVTVVLERLTSWLQTTDPKATASCAQALSLEETSDPETIWSWTDALTARLRRLAQAGDER